MSDNELLEVLSFKKSSRVYHPRDNLLRRSPGPSPARDKTRSKILLRMPCAQTCDLVRMPWAHGWALSGMPWDHRWNLLRIH